MDAPATAINGEAFNIGSSQQNYRVMQIAQVIQRALPATRLELAPDDPDKRSYRVNFDKAAARLGFQAEVTAEDGVREVLEGLQSGELDPDDPRTSTAKYYRYLLDAERVLAEVRCDGRIL
ncbi:hypothetical protein WCLP8_5590005 [uncultured Gammaproteobacteria bacterium]